MKFVDQATIVVEAGNGGNGCLSFRREKFIPFGGPDGGDGGDGGSIYLQGSQHLNTLIDFRYQRNYKAANGRSGMGKNRTGKYGDDLIIKVPVGTMVFDNESGENLGDLTNDNERLLVARGGFHGLGNTRFKSSINQAPRQTSLGTKGEARELRLELRLLADVGLLGFPNAGKSTLIHAITSAKPKIANYPFTTLHPGLGVVRIAPQKSFVVADLPGLIEGAAQGIGLGLHFLKHLTRTRILLHVIDISAVAESDPIADAKILINELKTYDPNLLAKPRWLVLNKTDLLTTQEVQTIKQNIITALNWQGKIYTISALTKQGTKELCLDLQLELDKMQNSTY